MGASAFDYEKHCGELGDAPRFRLLSDEKLARIHEASLQILENTGLRIMTAEGVELLRGAGCAVSDQDRVRIPRAVVEDAIASAPKRVVIYDRTGKEALFLDGKNTYFGLGITGIRYLDPETDEERDFGIEEIAKAVRVGDALPNLHAIGTPGVVQGTPEMPNDIVNHYEFATMVSNTTKPLTVLVANGSILRDVYEMAAVIAGSRDDLTERPFVIAYLNCVSPLTYNADTVDKLLLSAEWGIPALCIPAPQAGATSPVTLAGTIASANAETLGGIVLSQLKRPGAPFLTGSDPAIMDMRTGNIAFGAPEQSMLMIAAAEMAHYYGLPASGLGCASDSKRPDEQAAMEQMMSAYSIMLAGVHFVPYAGFIDSGIIFSPEAAVMGDEVLGMLKRIMRGVPVDDESLALALTDKVGPGGNYLDEEHTFTHFRTELWQPTVVTRATSANWAEAGRKTLGDRVKEKTVEILRTHEPQPVPEDVAARIAEIIEARRRSLA